MFSSPNNLVNFIFRPYFYYKLWFGSVCTWYEVGKHRLKSAHKYSRIIWLWLWKCVQFIIIINEFCTIFMAPWNTTLILMLYLWDFFTKFCYVYLLQFLYFILYVCISPVKSLYLLYFIFEEVYCIYSNLRHTFFPLKSN